MKRIITIFFAFLLAAAPCFAQRDVKVLNHKTASQVKAILGNPGPNADDFDQSDFPDIDHLEYDLGGTVIEIAKSSPQITYFSTNSFKYCFLSDYIKGGFKVGDTLARLKSFDFAKSKYGRNNQKNALKLGQDTEWYKAYLGEAYVLSFQIKNNKVIRIVLHQTPDAPYPGYSNAYCPF